MAVIHPSIFRAYDIRGIADQTLTAEYVFLIGKALGSTALENDETQIIIARDGRDSGLIFSQQLAAGILATGCDVIDLGMAPTPLLYFATQQFASRSGVMITGSHNPPEYNGLKMVIKGVTLVEQQIDALYQRILLESFLEGQGHYQTQNIIESYTQKMVDDICISRPLEIVIDAGNGITGMLAPQLFEQLGCKVHRLFCEVDGLFPHHHPDPSQPDNLQDLIVAVKEKKADIGIAFDGDGDRLGVVTNKGKIIWPDRLLMLFAQALLQEKPGAKIIYDVKCSHHLQQLITTLGGQPLMWKTGHSLIKAKLAEIHALLAGEMSGHFFFKDRWNGFDDALYAAARLLEIIAKHSQDSDVLFAALPDSINTPELKIAVAEEEKFSLMQQLIESVKSLEEVSEVLTIDGLRINFSKGWGLVRPSNTTPCLVLRFEAIDQMILEKIQATFRHWLLTVKPDLVIPF